jgi:hypothetical protein
LHFYDYRGAWQEQGGGAITPDAEGHLPSKWKLAGHPNTFVGGIHTPSGKQYKGGVLSVEQANYLVAKARTKAAKARVEQQVEASHKAAYEIMDDGGTLIRRNTWRSSKQERKPWKRSRQRSSRELKMR